MAVACLRPPPPSAHHPLLPPPSPAATPTPTCSHRHAPLQREDAVRQGPLHQRAKGGGGGRHARRHRGRCARGAWLSAAALLGLHHNSLFLHLPGDLHGALVTLCVLQGPACLPASPQTPRCRSAAGRRRRARRTACCTRAPRRSSTRWVGVRGVGWVGSPAWRETPAAGMEPAQRAQAACLTPAKTHPRPPLPALPALP